uniref:Uncharacterized protein n=1 Tax=Alexandrium monilatum TaxID=311494 RepID=A0A7S4S9B5_9DINO
MPGMPNGLDLSFGYTPMQFEKINLIGSELSEHAIFSLVLSVPNITYLDLRGNKLNAAFGWRLVKAMKKRYLNLEFCNGVPLKALRTNAIDSLNLAGVSGHHGMYGIEVVGAIFLAHFLRLNSSLTYLNFRRNNVQKDGAKALAQSLLGNPQCVLRTVNTMGPQKSPAKEGIDFSQFLTSPPQLTKLVLRRRLLDDDDFVFLEEWLRRYDCVTELDISENYICRDGVRKLTRYVKDTKTLKKLNCVGLPVDLEGSQLIARAVAENETLVQAGMPLGTCDEHPERQQMLQHLGIGLASHPCLETFATGRAEAIEWVNVTALRNHEVKAFPPQRSGNWHRGQMAVYMWFMAATKPPLEQLVFGPQGAPNKEYPSCTGAMPELWPSLVGCVKELHRTLTYVSINVPKGHANGMMDLMRVLTRCSSLKKLNLLGYAGAILKESQLPQDWTSVGAAPRWLIEDRVKKIKVHWQALLGLLGHLTSLEIFNEIALGGVANLRDQPEITVVLLMQCLEGVAGEFGTPTANGENVMVAKLQGNADVEAFCDVLRILSRTPLVVNLTINDKKVEVVKAQQKRLVGPLNGAPAGDQVPRFTHQVVLKNNQVSEVLLQQLDCHAPLKEFCFENLESVLPSLFAALCGKERPLLVEKIRVEPKWNQQCNARKRYGDKQRRWLDGVHAALLRSERFMVLESQSRGEVTRAELDGMSSEDFADAMTGINAGDPVEQTKHLPQVQWRCFPSARQFWKPTDDDLQADPLFVPLPMDEDSAESLKLRKLSLCMSNLRTRLAQAVRSDEFADPSRPLWDGPRRFVRPGDWNELEVPMEVQEKEEDPDREGEEGEDDESQHVRYHWRDHLRIGTHAANKALTQVVKPPDLPFLDTLVHEGLRSLLEGSTLTSLDLRGSGLTKADANVLLELVERNDVLVSLNMIPVTIEEAQACTELSLDGTGVPKLPAKAANEEEYDEEEDPEGEAFGREAFESGYCRMDEGDGFVFLSLVTPQYFPELRSVSLRSVEIPLDATLAHITDALLGLPSVESLQLSDLRLSSRGSTLLLQAVAEMSARLRSLNGLPLSQLVQLRDASDSGGALELPVTVEWNDFPLGAMARLNLWPYASFPPAAPDVPGCEFLLQGRSLTDVGLRGLCVMLRYFAGQERTPGVGSATRGGPSLGSLVRIDLSDNAQITDATVADLCHTLQHPSMGASLRHSLQELSVRSCSRLRTRSAYELLNFVHHVRDVARDAGATAPLGGSLKLINGVDLEVLQASSRSTSVGGRANGPPLLLRCFVDPPWEAGQQRLRKPRFAALSECDVHFFASILHLFSHIPYCHMHVVVPQDLDSDLTPEAMAPWGRPAVAGDDGPFAVVSVSNDSPFPPPVFKASVVAAIQAHFDAAKRFFEACPVSTQLRLSVAPSIPGCEDVLAQGDHAVLGAVPGSDQPSHMTANVFARVKKQLQEKAAKKRRARQPPGSDATPARPLYVNNINSQRLHCCFRTLYGKDEMELEHGDIMQDKHSVTMPGEVDVSHAFAVAASVDLQHLDLGPLHLSSLSRVTEMPMLTHINLNHNHLGDTGTELLFRALTEVQCSVVHVAVASNGIGDEGAAFISSSLANLPRLTSLELCDNFIQESGSIALAEAIGGLALPDEAEGEEAAPVGPLAVLSVDLRGNRSRELGARRWAEVVCAHPDLKFLCLAQNELGCNTKEYFLDLVCAAVASAALSVLDLQDNFLQPPGPGGRHAVGPPPADVIEELLADLPAGEFDPAEVRRAVFIRRHRGGGGSAPEKKGRQPQQGQQNGGGGAQRHAHPSPPPSTAGGASVQGTPAP